MRSFVMRSLPIAGNVVSDAICVLPRSRVFVITENISKHKDGQIPICHAALLIDTEFSSLTKVFDQQQTMRINWIKLTFIQSHKFRAIPTTMIADNNDLRIVVNMVSLHPVKPSNNRQDGARFRTQMLRTYSSLGQISRLIPAPIFTRKALLI